MLYLYNTPLFIIIGSIVLIFVALMGFKIIREIKFNKLLKKKQGQMRINNQNTALTKRIGLLGTLSFVPIALFLLMVTFASQPIRPIGDLQAIQNSNDIIEIYNQYTRYNRGDNAWDGSLDAVPESNDEQDQGSDDYSKTNTQVEGVDEMDNVVTDGHYIYQIKDNQVYISLAYTQTLGSDALSNYKTISYQSQKTSCPTGMSPTGLYVDDNYLIVVGSEYEGNCDFEDGFEPVEPMAYNYWRSYNNVKIYVYDKNNDFALTSDYKLSGHLIGTRKINNQIYIISSTNIPFYNDDIDVEDYLPYYLTNDSKTITKYSDITYVNGIEPNAFTSFFSINLDNDAIDMEVILGDSGYNLYVSHQNIYLVGNIYNYQTETDETDEDISGPKTAIQKVSINEGDLQYKAVGTIPGYTLNQFSMDEYQGYLRIATTSNWWGQGINNRLFVLDENLQEVSRLENLGKPGETIKSVRYSSDYGYLVTFQQTDPFYVINLSDPEAPFKEGELEIPGFSTYLQSLNDTYMLGIGFGDSSGGTNGLKISIYDISDKTDPFVFNEVIFDYEEFGWGSSSATYNHKDLLVDLAKGIIALPFSTYTYNQTTGYQYNSGILVYDFDETEGLTQQGFITHGQNTEEEVYVYKIKFIDQYFYTISDQYIKASLISDPETIINSLNLPENQSTSNDDE